MNALTKAQETMDWVDGENSRMDEYFIAKAHALAAIAQAEALNRLADATERRNELLEEFNQTNAAAGRKHTEDMNRGVKKILDAVFGEDAENHPELDAQLDEMERIAEAEAA